MKTRLLSTAVVASLALAPTAMAQMGAPHHSAHGMPHRHAAPGYAAPHAVMHGRAAAPMMAPRPMVPHPVAPPAMLPPPVFAPAVAPAGVGAVQPMLPHAGMPPYTPYTLDIRGYYGFRALPHSACATDMVGAEAEFACYVTPRQAVTFSGSFGFGRHDARVPENRAGGPAFMSEEFSRNDFAFMVGYRFTQPLSPYVSLSFGVKGGVDIQELSCDEDRGDRSEISCGFGYAAYATLEAQLGWRTRLQLGYQFRGATTRPDAPGGYEESPAVSVHSLRWHEVHLGVRFLF